MINPYGRSCMPSIQASIVESRDSISNLSLSRVLYLLLTITCPRPMAMTWWDWQHGYMARCDESSCGILETSWPFRQLVGHQSQCRRRLKEVADDRGASLSRREGIGGAGGTIHYILNSFLCNLPIDIKNNKDNIWRHGANTNKSSRCFCVFCARQCLSLLS